mgnify:FL=1
MKMISIAIDGPSGAGKSTMARKVAAELNYLYVDTGAIYRSVSLYAYRAGVDKNDSEKIVSLLPEIHIDMQYQADGIQHMILNGEDVTDAIRQNEVSLYTSAVAAIPAVRAFLLDLQRNLAATHNVIMDGRDIGTVVLPNATVKIYLTASAEARAQRRWLDLLVKGDPIPLEQVLEDVQQRDYNDTHRDVAPLRQAEDAVLVDTTECDLEESYQLLLNTIRERI